jgi:SAM-dependent methyltransferase
MAFDFSAAYEDLNPADRDYRFYAALADELGAERVLDLGCGTGRLARLLASAGRAVVGVDPDPEMIRVARGRPGGERVEWVLGFSDRAGSGSADLAVMSGHVAQVFLDDAEWQRVLGDLYRALVPGGTLAFESRDPEARGWERWTRALTLRTVDTAEGPVEFWHETAEVALPLVAYDTFTRNLRTGEETSERDVLAFRDRDELAGSLASAGFNNIRRYGDWPPGAGSAEIILVAGKDR